MLFNSFQFILFLPCVIILYYMLPHKTRWVLLLCASYYFYMVWKPEYIILIIISTLVDYTAGILMEKQQDRKKRKALLFMSLFANLGLLFVFKYFNFFYGQLGEIYSLISNKEFQSAGLKLILPMGISFYTFQTLSYSIDVYRGNRGAEKHLGYFALYVTFFPQLVAGPIERSDRLLPQLREKHKFNYENFMSALLRICWGFFKKIVIADRVAQLVNMVYGNLSEFRGLPLIIATLGFALQIYCDFSAYSDIAIGSAKMMGVDLMENFKMPYFSKSISEFWSRWHISLSTWFKDYLYIPLGGNRVDKRWKYYRNILIVFLVSGFWHGAEWTFLIWGALHGIYSVVERITDKKLEKINGFMRTVITFVLVLFAWIFFRADNVQDAFFLIKNLGFGNIGPFMTSNIRAESGLDKYYVVILVFSSILLLVTDYIKYKKNKQILISNDFLQGLACIALIMYIILFGYYGSYKPNEFIYFQF